MSLEPKYLRQRARDLSILIRIARDKAVRALLERNSTRVDLYARRVEAYRQELAVLNKPPYWHRANRDTWWKARRTSDWVDHPIEMKAGRRPGKSQTAQQWFQTQYMTHFHHNIMASPSQLSIANCTA